MFSSLSSSESSPSSSVEEEWLAASLPISQLAPKVHANRVGEQQCSPLNSVEEALWDVLEPGHGPWPGGRRNERSDADLFCTLPSPSTPAWLSSQTASTPLRGRGFLFADGLDTSPQCGGRSGLEAPSGLEAAHDPQCSGLERGASSSSTAQADRPQPSTQPAAAFPNTPPPTQASAEGQETLSPPKVVLRRTSVKRPPTEQELAEYSRRHRISANIESAMKADAPAVQACLTAFKMPPWLFEALRRRYCKYYAEQHEVGAASMSYKDFRQEARAHFHKAGVPLRIKLLKELLKEEDEGSEKWKAVSMAIGTYQSKNTKGTLGESRCNRVDTHTALFTYNSDAWILGDLAVQEGAVRLDHETLQAHAKALPQVVDAWARFRAFAEQRSAELKAKWASSCELCLGTYKDTGLVRFHLTLSLSRPQKMKFTTPWDCLAFEGVPAIFKPYMTEGEIAKISKKRGLNQMFAQVAYYLQFPKKGGLYSAGCQQPYKDYRVNARWVTEYLQAGIWSSGQTRVIDLGLVK